MTSLLWLCLFNSAQLLNFVMFGFKLSL